VLDNVKLGYLVLYNGIQWSGFILIFLALLKSLRGGSGKYIFLVGQFELGTGWSITQVSPHGCELIIKSTVGKLS